MTDTTPGITRIGQIAVPVKDLDRAVGFYTDVLGLPFLFRVPNMAFLRGGETTIMLTIPEAEFDHPASVLYYEVGDLHAAHAAVSGKGAQVRRPPALVHRAADHELWMAFYLDTEGNTLALTSRVAV
jgi:methylmalonyl-CoA/ethylmalonyl-CoA epimerase